MTILFGILTTIIVILQLYKHWRLSQGKLKIVYILNIIVFSCYFVTESMVSLNSPTQWPLFFMNIVNVFGIITSIKGLMRLKEEENSEKNHNRLKGY